MSILSHPQELGLPRSSEEAPVSRTDARITQLSRRWPLGTAVRHNGTGRHGVLVLAADEFAARWNDGREGHIALMPYRDRATELGALLYVRWSCGDECWTRIDVLAADAPTARRTRRRVA